MVALDGLRKLRHWKVVTLRHLNVLMTSYCSDVGALGVRSVMLGEARVTGFLEGLTAVNRYILTLNPSLRTSSSVTDITDVSKAGTTQLSQGYEIN